MAEYIVKSTLCLAILFGFYHLILRNVKIFQFIRFFLFFSLFFALVIPLISFKTRLYLPISNAINEIPYINITIIEEKNLIATQINLFSIQNIFLFVYLLISVLLFLRFLFNLFHILRIAYKGRIVNGTKPSIVLVEKKILPYSFFNLIFVNQFDYEKDNIPLELLLHEKAHCMQYHSLDIMFVEFIKIILWFNPFVWLFASAMKLNHEYLADNVVVNSTKRNESYLDILLNMTFRENNSYLVSNIKYSFSKRRILMITKTNHSKKTILKKLITIPVFILAGLLVLDTHEINSMSSNSEPPQPPTFGDNTWWEPILAQHGVTPNPSNSWYTNNVYETGDQFVKEENTITLRDAFILSKSVDNLYRIVRAKLVLHNLSTNHYSCEGAEVETYKQEDNGKHTLINNEYYKDFGFRIIDDIIAPPPPPPPSAGN